MAAFWAAVPEDARIIREFLQRGHAKQLRHLNLELLASLWVLLSKQLAQKYFWSICRKVKINLNLVLFEAWFRHVFLNTSWRTHSLHFNANGLQYLYRCEIEMNGGKRGRESFLLTCNCITCNSKGSKWTWDVDSCIDISLGLRRLMWPSVTINLSLFFKYFSFEKWCIYLC